MPLPYDGESDFGRQGADQLTTEREIKEEEESEEEDIKEGIKKEEECEDESGFRDLMLRPELLRAIMDCGFEHPSEVQPKELRLIAKKFMQEPIEVYVDDEAKLTLHGLQQYYVKLKESDKTKKLLELLDILEFNQVVIFLRSVNRCQALDKLLTEQNFPSIAIHRQLGQEERLAR